MTLKSYFSSESSKKTVGNVGNSTSNNELSKVSFNISLLEPFISVTVTVSNARNANS